MVTQCDTYTIIKIVRLQTGPIDPKDPDRGQECSVWTNLAPIGMGENEVPTQAFENPQQYELKINWELPGDDEQRVQIVSRNGDNGNKRDA